MEIIRKHADDFIKPHLFDQSRYKEIISDLKFNLNDYYRQSDKVIFLERVSERVKEAFEKHRIKCKNPDTCKELSNYNSIVFFIEQELYDQGISKDDLFDYSEENEISVKIDKLIEAISTTEKRFSKLEKGQEIIYEDIVDQLEKLKKQFYLDKKTWRQIFIGKIFEMTISGNISKSISEKIIEIFSDIFSREILTKLLN